jgi:hypothetical protein
MVSFGGLDFGPIQKNEAMYKKCIELLYQYIDINQWYKANKKEIKQETETGHCLNLFNFLKIRVEQDGLPKVYVNNNVSWIELNEQEINDVLIGSERYGFFTIDLTSNSNKGDKYFNFCLMVAMYQAFQPSFSPIEVFKGLHFNSKHRALSEEKFKNMKKSKIVLSDAKTFFGFYKSIRNNLVKQLKLKTKVNEREFFYNFDRKFKEYIFNRFIYKIIDDESYPHNPYFQYMGIPRNLMELFSNIGYVIQHKDRLDWWAKSAETGVGGFDSTANIDSSDKASLGRKKVAMLLAFTVEDKDLYNDACFKDYYESLLVRGLDSAFDTQEKMDDIFNLDEPLFMAVLGINNKHLNNLMYEINPYLINKTHLIDGHFVSDQIGYLNDDSDFMYELMKDFYENLKRKFKYELFLYDNFIDYQACWHFTLTWLDAYKNKFGAYSKIKKNIFELVYATYYFCKESTQAMIVIYSILHDRYASSEIPKSLNENVSLDNSYFRSFFNWLKPLLLLESEDSEKKWFEYPNNQMDSILSYLKQMNELEDQGIKVEHSSILNDVALMIDKSRIQAVKENIWLH